MIGDPAYADDGTLLGHYDQADDGAIVIVNPDGYVLAAATPDGTALDAADYQVAEPTPERELAPQDAARLAAIAQYVGPPEPPDLEQAQLEEAVAWMRKDAAHQAQRLQAQLGRDLTVREAQAIGERIAHEAEQGRHIDVAAAYYSVLSEGKIREFDPARHQDRVDLALERLQDEQGPRTAREDGYDMNDRDQRVQFMTDRMAGLVDPAATPEPVDTPEPADTPEPTTSQEVAHA